MSGHRHTTTLTAAEQAIARHGSLTVAIEQSGLPERDLRRAWRQMTLAAATRGLVTPHRKPSDPAPCGTYAAYKRHLRRKERIDAACRSAAYVANAETAARRRSAP